MRNAQMTDKACGTYSVHSSNKCPVLKKIYIAYINIPVISWMSVLLVGETGVHRENHRLVASH